MAAPVRNTVTGSVIIYGGGEKFSDIGKKMGLELLIRPVWCSQHHLISEDLASKLLLRTFFVTRGFFLD